MLHAAWSSFYCMFVLIDVVWCSAFQHGVHLRHAPIHHRSHVLAIHRDYFQGFWIASRGRGVSECHGKQSGIAVCERQACRCLSRSFTIPVRSLPCPSSHKTFAWGVPLPREVRQKHPTARVGLAGTSRGPQQARSLVQRAPPPPPRKREQRPALRKRKRRGPRCPPGGASSTHRGPLPARM